MKDIIAISRDEGLIREAEREVGAPNVRFLVGDICDPKAMNAILDGVDVVYHAAAMKHVSIAEKNPREVLRINVLGTLNILDHAKGLDLFINISSDKAIGVTNCYGSSKLLAEYIVEETNRIFLGKFINIRCPNFLASRGSVLDNWMRTIRKTNTIQLTDPTMTRYFITMHDAAKFIVDTSTRHDLSPNERYYPLEQTRKFRLGDLAQAFVRVYGNGETRIETIGKQPGEKLHEDYIADVRFDTVGGLEKVLRDTLGSP